MYENEQAEPKIEVKSMQEGISVQKRKARLAYDLAGFIPVEERIKAEKA